MFLELKNITFSYDGHRKVLDDVSFDVSKGDTVAIVGASGCGKSTLLRLISSILPLGNSIFSGGQITITDLTASAYRKLGKLAFMFQEPTLMPNLTVKQNIKFPLLIKKIENNSKVGELLKTVGLSNFADFLPKHLSGGMKTRVALARSFVTEPELLLLDEPFSALDIAWKTELYKELNHLKKKYGTTVIFVTHDIDEAMTLAGKNILVLSKQGNVMLDVKTNKAEGIKEEINRRIINDHTLLLK